METKYLLSIKYTKLFFIAVRLYQRNGKRLHKYYHTPKMIAKGKFNGHLYWLLKSSAVKMEQHSPPRAPSIVFLGDTSVSLVLPKYLPTK